MDDLAERTQSQTNGISLGFRRPESISPEIAPDVEERARELGAAVLGGNAGSR